MHLQPKKFPSADAGLIWAEISFVIADQRKSEKPSLFSLPPSAPYDHFQAVRRESRTVPGQIEEKHVKLAKTIFNKVIAKQSAVLRLLIERTIGTSAEVATGFLYKRAGQ